MRGDQLVRLWQVLRGIEASPNRLTMDEIAARDGHRELYGWKALQKPIPITGMGFFVMRGRSQCHGEGAGKAKDLFDASGPGRFSRAASRSGTMVWGGGLCLEFVAESFSFAYSNRSGSSREDYEKGVDRVCHFIQSSTSSGWALISKSV